MDPIRITPQAVLDEALKFNRKLTAGLDTLRTLGNTDYGCTAKDEVWREDKRVLYRYRRETPASVRTPLLIVYAMVNRPYMVDLQSDRSIVRALLEAGHEVYILDWGYPDRSDCATTLDDTINGTLVDCVREVSRRHGGDPINLLGICQGGAFSLCYSALYPHTVRNLITMVTPVDFHTPDNMLSHWTRELDVDLFVHTLGNVPADLMNWCYLTLKPFRLLHQKYVGLVDLLDNPAELENFVRMEKWIFDSPDQIGATFRQFIRDFYQGNKLKEGGLRIGEREVDLRQLSMPLLNIYAEQDHLVPPDASRALRQLHGSSDYTELAFKGGHIGIYVSGRAQREVPPAISHWLKSHE